MTEYPEYIQTTIVDGLEQFVGLRWTVVACDHPGCENTYPADGVGFRWNRESQLISEVKEAGWTGNLTRQGPCLCPNHKVEE